MDEQGMRERYEFGCRLIEEAGALALSYFERLSELTVKGKGPQDVVSEADVDTEVLIRDRLAERFPGDGFLGEETGRSDFDERGGIWVVDPIDGTQPFVCGMSSWCVSIAFVHAGQLQMGFISSPARNEVFAGWRGHGATLNGRPISVRTATRLDEGIVEVGYSPRIGADDVLHMFDRLLRQGGMYYRDGSGALALAYVAAGRLIGYVEAHMNSWDCLGAMAVIEAAGGRVNDFLVGDALWKGNVVIAGSPELYPKLAELAVPPSRAS